MLFDGIDLAEGSDIENVTIAKGASFPARIKRPLMATFDK